MKLNVTAKLFLAVLCVGALCALAMGTVTLYSFNRGFIGYLNDQGAQRLEELVPEFAAAYIEHGSWNFLRESRRAWVRLIMPARPAEPGAGGNPPAPGFFTDSELTGVGLRVALRDANGEYVAGNLEAREDAITRPVIVGGTTVGRLALIPFQQVTGAAHLRFQRQQVMSTWIIAGLTVLLAATVALILARMFLAPIRRIAAATHRIAGGDYAHRISSSSGDEIGRLAEDFNRLALNLQRNEQMRRAFMADVSHELRTPIAVLRAELEAMDDGIRPLNTRGIHELKLSIEVLGKLVDDLHELSLSDAGALTYRKSDIDLREVLRDSMRSFEERFAKQRLLINATLPENPVCVHADESRMRQLFANLLENTIRYTHPGGRVLVGCSEEGDTVSIDLQDSAPGVPEEVLPHLFERFYRAKGDDGGGLPGTGLGLAICRNIVEAHGGTIEARPSPLGGLWLAIRLPGTRG